MSGLTNRWIYLLLGNGQKLMLDFALRPDRTAPRASRVFLQRAVARRMSRWAAINVFLASTTQQA